jgi:hypothetical protein
MTRAIMSAALLTACLTLTGCGGPGPGESAAEFTKAAANGDAATAKKYVAPEDLKNPGPVSFEDAVKKMEMLAKEKKGVKSVSVAEEKITGDTAQVKLTIEWGNGDRETSPDYMSMKKVDGTWYIAD